MLRRYISFSLSALILLLSIICPSVPLSASAAAANCFTLDCTYEDGTAELLFAVGGDVNICGFEADLLYPADICTVSAVQVLNQNVLQNHLPEKGVIAISWAEVQNTNTAGDLLRVTFECSEKPAKDAFRLNVRDAYLIDENQDFVTAEYTLVQKSTGLDDPDETTVTVPATTTTSKTTTSKTTTSKTTTSKTTTSKTTTSKTTTSKTTTSKTTTSKTTVSATTPAVIGTDNVFVLQAADSEDGKHVLLSLSVSGDVAFYTAEGVVALDAKGLGQPENITCSADTLASYNKQDGCIYFTVISSSGHNMETPDTLFTCTMPKTADDCSLELTCRITDISDDTYADADSSVRIQNAFGSSTTTPAVTTSTTKKSSTKPTSSTTTTTETTAKTPVSRQNQFIASASESDDGSSIVLELRVAGDVSFYTAEGYLTLNRKGLGAPEKVTNGSDTLASYNAEDGHIYFTVISSTGKNLTGEQIILTCILPKTADTVKLGCKGTITDICDDSYEDALYSFRYEDLTAAQTTTSTTPTTTTTTSTTTTETTTSTTTTETTTTTTSTTTTETTTTTTTSTTTTETTTTTTTSTTTTETTTTTTTTTFTTTTSTTTTTSETTTQTTTQTTTTETSTTEQTTTTPEDKTLPGDINGDKKVNVKDAVLFVRFITEDSFTEEEMPDSALLSTADFDGDGILTILDVCILLRELQNP